MAAERWIHHVTMQTAHVRRSLRSEVADEVVAQLRPVLEQALTGKPAALWVPGYTISGGVHGRCCMVTVWGYASDTASPERQPVLSVGIAPHSRCGAVLWRTLHETGGPYATDPEKVPPEPWVADRIELGMALHPDATSWTGDFARSIAWTWLEMGSR